MAKRIAVFASGNGSNFQVIAEQFPVESLNSLVLMVLKMLGMQVLISLV